MRGRTLVGAGGTEREVDAVVFCTGFQPGFRSHLRPLRAAARRGLHASEIQAQIVDQPAPFDVIGRGGADLRARWNDEARAYLGTTVPDVPNLFVITGPNTGLGHNSMVFMVEAQFAYVLDALRVMRARGPKWVDVREGALREFADEMERRAAGTTFRSGCRSGYRKRTATRATWSSASPRRRPWARGSIER